MGAGLKKEALLIFVLLLFASAYFYQDPGWNGNSRLGLTAAIVQEGRFTIDSFHETKALGTGDQSLYAGHYYSDKAIGTSLIGTIVYWPLYWLLKLLRVQVHFWIVKYIMTIFVIALPSALAGSLLYLACRAITAHRIYAYIATVAISLGTMWFPYSSVFFGHALAAALLFCAFFMIFRLRWSAVVPPGWYLCVIGLVLGFALITEYTTVLIVVPLIVYYLYMLWHKPPTRTWRGLGVPALGGLIPLALLAAYNTLSFGSPWSLGYDHLENAIFSESMGQGFMGIHVPKLDVLYYLTVHPAQGIFWQSPVLLLSLVGTVFMLYTPRYRPEALLTISAFVAYLLMNAGYYMWWGGWAFGPRHLVPMLPFLGLPLLFVPKRLFPLVVVCTLVSIAQMLIVVASAIQVPDDVMAKIREVGYFQYSTIYSYCMRQLLDGGFAWNLGQLLGLKAAASLLPLLAGIAGISGFFCLPRFVRAYRLVQPASGA